MNDSNIIEAIREGNEKEKGEAIDALMLRSGHIPQVVSGQTGIKFEIMQESHMDAVVDLVEKIQTERFVFQNEGGILKYLKTATFRQGMRSHRKEPSSKNLDDISEDQIDYSKLYNSRRPNEHLQHQKDVPVHLTWKEDIENYEVILAKLSPKCRDLLLMLLCKEMTIAECAEKLETTAVNVRVRKHRCLCEGREILKKMNDAG